MTALRLIAIALIAAVLVYPSDAIPIPFGTRFILLGALAIGSVIWLTSEDKQREEEEERIANEQRWQREQQRKQEQEDQDR